SDRLSHHTDRRRPRADLPGTPGAFSHVQNCIPPVGDEPGTAPRPVFSKAVPPNGTDDFQREAAMSGKLEGKVAVVTGASKGIGAGIARHLAAEVTSTAYAVALRHGRGARGSIWNWGSGRRWPERSGSGAAAAPAREPRGFFPAGAEATALWLSLSCAE